MKNKNPDPSAYLKKYRKEQEKREQSEQSEQPLTNTNKVFKEQVGGDHYMKMKIQPTEYILANDLGFCEGNIVKYASRWKNKNGIEDLKKIIQYAEILIADEVERQRLTECCPKEEK